MYIIWVQIICSKLLKRKNTISPPIPFYVSLGFSSCHLLLKRANSLSLRVSKVGKGREEIKGKGIQNLSNCIKSPDTILTVLIKCTSSTQEAAASPSRKGRGKSASELTPEPPLCGGRAADLSTLRQQSATLPRKRLEPGLYSLPPPEVRRV